MHSNRNVMVPTDLESRELRRSWKSRGILLVVMENNTNHPSCATIYLAQIKRKGKDRKCEMLTYAMHVRIKMVIEWNLHRAGGAG